MQSCELSKPGFAGYHSASRLETATATHLRPNHSASEHGGAVSEGNPQRIGSVAAWGLG